MLGPYNSLSLYLYYSWTLSVSLSLNCRSQPPVAVRQRCSGCFVVTEFTYYGRSILLCMNIPIRYRVRRQSDAPVDANPNPSILYLRDVSAISVGRSEWYIERAPAGVTPHDLAVDMSFLLVVPAFRNISARRVRPSRRVTTSS